MASTTFIDGQTTIFASWLNDVNTAVYTGVFPNGNLSLTNLTVSGTVTGAGFTSVVNANLLSPGPIGSTTPNTGKFTTLQATSLTGLTTALSASQGGTGLTSPGTSGNVLTSNGTGWVSSTPTVVKGLGLGGETWHTTSNSQNNTYTNSRSYPIMVAVNGYMTANGYTAIAYVNGVYVAQFGGGTGSQQCITFIVPPGSTYQVSATSFSQAGWSELY